MRDLFFYPICALFVGAVIWYALSFTQEREPIDPSKGFEVSGENLQYFLVPDQLDFSLTTDSQTGETVAVLTSNVNIKTAPPSAGLCMRLGFELETAFAERELEMIVRARAGDSSPTTKFQMGYFVIGQKGSGWKEFTPDAGYKDYKIKLKKGALKGETRGDFAGIWPDLDGKGRTLNVASIIVKPVKVQLNVLR